ncbi:MAG: DUF2520 domain-containing protein [Chlamydiia bacterium]|nr:DUF2520 domain-containing protein [Chlamydiia bacterium]
MRQVPTTTPYAVLGNGRLARHICHYLHLLSIPYVQWDRQQGPLSTSKIAHCQTVLILLSDRAIESFIEQYPGLRTLQLVHCSGALNTAAAFGAHPLSTFSDRLYDEQDYRRIPFVVDADAPPFEQLFPGLPNAHFRLDRAKKALYHALCVLAGNGTTLLWQKLCRGFEDLGLPAEAAQPYLQCTIRNLLECPQTALTGPIARGDHETLQRNLDALGPDPFAEVLRSLIQAYHLQTATGAVR